MAIYRNILLLLSAFTIRTSMADGDWGHNTFYTNDDRALQRRQHGPLGPVPKNSVVRSYNFTISREYKAPDGIEKHMMVVNNQFPGPLIEAEWGDVIEVHVHNALDDQGTAIHWHGLPQTETPWYDGVPSVSQCPIAPGETFTYRFRAEVYGTTWWHAHYSAQYMDGVWGPLIIHGPKYADYDIDMGPILLSDHVHLEYQDYILPIYNIPPEFPPVHNNLINGKMPYNRSLGGGCMSEGVSRFRFETGKTHLLRLINTGGSANQKFSIDNHELIVIANDFVPIEPYTTDVVTLGTGQRSDVLVVANGDPTDAVWMRSDLDVTCIGGGVISHQPNATAAVYYPEADTGNLPNTEKSEWEYNGCINDPLSKTVPLFSKVPPQPDITMSVNITGGPNGTGHAIFYMNGSSLYADYGTPSLFEAYNGRRNFSNNPEWNLVNTGAASSIRLVVYTDFQLQHSMHLHGVHDFWVLAEGFGTWNGTITNPTNPQRRDVQLMYMGTPEQPSYMVIQWDATNPGVWPFHCHLVLHSSTGLFMSFLQQPDKINNEQLPTIIDETCTAWRHFANNNHVDQPDSGQRNA
ncbi:extracellular dihydrogeodin oxidase/laccase-like protein [Stachybotrys elegans]|uniref:Extracellular dihydrogeodin oxidase/laccase-like protein n=1 Tax=Stachybotrys elegans TaxID=80388 RepID=A0A8K0SJF8_9HYPO|nr:extracellular dihydrogeodin oxidase/laccase-like protein [Stachybotrys elegans]